ncbi:iron-sulfur cluster assembly scaffold protein [Hyphobacterium marinum]|uniref:Iron-sulfur cluster assembly scaffold protein n=1 Tax=Hyphobacterium marinum TaxID=3116574 RepID=A0ABU7LZD5_9PROT|nr:iron-sulfur cluster assembly scaffold protein [Hyphobacterium sp. Y6023]MEE2566355.1 iron-sulfur cluster assembly scaffold protein [Hyphobacterium sp. Y6023]
MDDALYSSALLRLAAEIPHIGRLARPEGSARRVSRLCGSAVEVDLAVENGRIANIGLEVKACALGQASASVLGANAIGASLDEILSARDGLAAMLKGGPVPQGRFADLSALEGTRAYPARHASIRLAFEAAAEAFLKALDTTETTTVTG